jgi:hypothetical protein
MDMGTPEDDSNEGGCHGWVDSVGFMCWCQKKELVFGYFPFVIFKL